MKKQTLFKIGMAALVVGVPLITFASSKDLKGIMDIIVGYFQNFIKLIIGLAVLSFIWNIYKYFIKTDAERKEAGMYVLYSVLGFFIILSLWGLVNIVSRTFNLDNSQPSWPFSGSGGGGSNPLDSQTTNTNSLDSQTTRTNLLNTETGQPLDPSTFYGTDTP